MEERRITITNLPRGVYDYALHHLLADRGRRRYNPYSFDFDSTPLSLDEPTEHWDETVTKNHYADYGDGLLSDEEFAKAVRERDRARVVT
jgi:hypothetical protein